MRGRGPYSGWRGNGTFMTIERGQQLRRRIDCGLCGKLDA